MATQTLEQGRYLGGRPPYGYRLGDAGPHPNKAHAAWGRRAHRLEPDPETAPVVTVDVRAAAGRAQRCPDHPRFERCRGAVPVGGRPGPQPAPDRSRMDAAHGRGDPGQPAVHGPAGVEPAADRLGPGRPGQHHPRAPAGAAVEPARRLGHLKAAGACGAGQRGGLHRGPGRCRAARTRRPGGAPVPAGRAARLRSVRAAAGISVVQRQGRLPVPPRLHQRRRARSRPAEEHLPARGPRSCRTWPPCPSSSPAAGRRDADAGPASPPRPGPRT